MVDVESGKATAVSEANDSSVSKQAACQECRRSKVRCVRPPDATSCRKCTNAGIECVVPKYHVGRYKGVKNKRSGLDKAIYQVEEAVKKARTHGADLHDRHAQALQSLLREGKEATLEDGVEEFPVGASHEPTVPPSVPASMAENLPTNALVRPQLQQVEGESFVPVQESDGDITVKNANNPLQLLAIASSMPEPLHEGSTPALGDDVSPSVATIITNEEDETLGFFRPMVSKLDTGKEIDPLELGLISEQEVEVLFDFFHQNLAHTRWGLDRQVHSTDFVRSRSAFLFTSILACSSLFLHDMSSLCVRLNNHCRHLARRIITENYKSVEIVLAYMINVPWMQPGKTWALDDETCHYLSIAMAIAIDLSLNKIVMPSSTVRSRDIMERTAPAECIEAQRALNMDNHVDIDPSSLLGRRLLRTRERTWLALFTLDRGVCLARGRPWTVPMGPLIETCDAWHVSDIADLWDGSLIASAVLRRDLGALVTNIRTTCDNHRFTGDEGSNLVKTMREKVEGFFAQWYHTWTYQIQQSDGSLPPYVEILVSHGKLSAYCSVINHPTASGEVKQFFKSAGLTAALHVIRVAIQNESKLRSMPNNSVIMVSFAACFVLGLSTVKRDGQVYVAEHVKKSIYEAADVLERIGSVTIHRKGASTLFGRHIKRIMKLHASSFRMDTSTGASRENDPGIVPASSNGFMTMPYALHSNVDEVENFFPGFESMTDDQLLKAIQNSKDDIDIFNAGIQNEDSLFMDWLDWPNLT